MGQPGDYTWKGACGPFVLGLAAGVFTPSRTSQVIADAMAVRPGETVLDVGCGCGVLAVVAARMGARRVVGCDVSDAAVTCARANADRLGIADVAEFRAGHLFDAVRDVRADVILADISGVPDPIAAVSGWFPDGRGGGPTGAELPVAMLKEIAPQLAPGGRVYLPTGTIQDEDTVLAAARTVFGSMELVAQREFPLPDAVVADPRVAELIDAGVLRFGRRGSRLTWRLTVWCATL
jgi:protein-L-isoaspartate O-methyltransferase